MKQWMMRKMAFIMAEQDLQLNEIDKIFSSLWVANDELLFASKDLQIKTLKLKRSNKFEIKNFWTFKDCYNSQQSVGKKGIGIHSIVLYPNKTLGDVVVWGAVNDIYFKNLKNSLIWSIKAHADTIYSLVVLSSSILLSGSRDGSLCLTNINERKSSCFHLRMGCIRALSRLDTTNIVGALNSFNGHLESWDFNCGARIRSWNLPKKEELVCMGIINSIILESFNNCFAVGSQNNVTFLDNRCPNYCFSVNIIDQNAGTRSLLYKNEHLIVGTGTGRISFFDIRTKQYLMRPSCDHLGVHHLESSSGWVGSNPYDLNNIENAIYTLEFNDDRNLLFAGGGPIRANVQGSYAGLWRI